MGKRERKEEEIKRKEKKEKEKTGEEKKKENKAKQENRNGLVNICHTQPPQIIVECSCDDLLMITYYDD